MTPIESFANRDDLADAAATCVAQALTATGAGTLVVAGGSTPGPLYDRLARRALGWDRLAVTLTDERWVDPTSDESNEALIRRRLLVGEAARARFAPLKGDGATPEADADTAEARLRALPPFAAVVLGMGEDGHVASLFPGAPELPVGLDLDGPRLCIAVARAGLAPFVPRISLTVRALTGSALVILLISGDAKRTVVDRIADDPAYAPPAASILRQHRAPARVMWAP